MFTQSVENNGLDTTRMSKVRQDIDAWRGNAWVNRWECMIGWSVRETLIVSMCVGAGVCILQEVQTKIDLSNTWAFSFWDVYMFEIWCIACKSFALCCSLSTCYAVAVPGCVYCSIDDLSVDVMGALVWLDWVGLDWVGRDWPEQRQWSKQIHWNVLTNCLTCSLNGILKDWQFS